MNQDQTEAFLILFARLVKAQEAIALNQATTLLRLTKAQETMAMEQTRMHQTIKEMER